MFWLYHARVAGASMSRLYACYRGRVEGTVRLNSCPGGYSAHLLGWVSNAANPGRTRTALGELWRQSIAGYNMATYSGRTENTTGWSRVGTLGYVWPRATD